MQDTVIKNTGNSMSLGSVPNFMALYPDYESFAAAMAEKTLPIDLGPLNAAGCDVIGTLLNKANLLPDSVENAIWGSAANRTPAQALQQLRSLITTAQSTANTLSATKAQAQIVSYTGTGTHGANNPCRLTFSFAPKIIIYQIPGCNVNNTDRWYWLSDMWTTEYTGVYFGTSTPSGYAASGKKSNNGKTFEWYVEYVGSGTGSASWVANTINNTSNVLYRYVGIG